MLARQLDLAHKLYTYGVAALESPRQIPALALAAARGAHVGELIKLRRHRQWLAGAGIGSVLDIGAHRGEFSSALRRFLPDAHITAFEPLADCHETLVAKLAPGGRFTAHQVAVATEEREGVFHRSSFSKASSLLEMAPRHEQEFPWSRGSEEVPVAVRRLDSFADELVLEPRCLMKIDVQGAELQVLEGALRTLERTHYVLVETSFAPFYDGQADFEGVYEFLRACGFSFAGVWDQLQSKSDGTILQADALFRREN